MTILLLAGAALAALAAFRRSPEGESATANDTKIVAIRRSTSIVLAFAEALWTILDALVLVTGRRVSAVNAAQRSPGSLIARPSVMPNTSDIGTTPAADVVEA